MSVVCRRLFFTTAAAASKRVVHPTNAHKAFAIAPRTINKFLYEEKARLERIERRTSRNRSTSERALGPKGRKPLFQKELAGLVGRAFHHEALAHRSLVGRGINITRTKLSEEKDGDGQASCSVYWFSTEGADAEDAIQELLEDAGPEVEVVLAHIAPEIGRPPRIQFVKDTEYVARAVLNSEFDRLDRDLGLQPEPAQQDSSDEEVFSARKKTDVLQLDREAAMAQIARSLRMAAAEHRLSPNTAWDPDGPAPDFFGFSSTAFRGRQSEDGGRRSVQKYLGRRRRDALREERILRENLQFSHVHDDDDDLK